MLVYARRLSIRLAAAAILVVSIAAFLSASILSAVIKENARGVLPPSLTAPHYGSTVSRFLSWNGDIISEFASSSRIYAPLNKIPPLLQQAFISAEDRNFWHHNGVDFAAIVRAGFTDLMRHSSGRRRIGASTITQQVVKNLTNDNRPTMQRKIREAIQAIELEKQVGKKAILEAYLNDIYLGHGAYGVAAAAKIYFNKDIGNLSDADVAFLAALPKGPTIYDPTRNPGPTAARREYVLTRMLSDGVIDRGRWEVAAKVPLPAPASSSLGGVATDYYQEEVRREVTAALGTDALYNHGLTVKTGLDPRLQELAEKSLRDGLIAYDRRHGWRGPVGRLRDTTDFSDRASWLPALLAVGPAPLQTWHMAVVLSSNGGGAQLGLDTGDVRYLSWDGMAWVGHPAAGRNQKGVQSYLRPGDIIPIEIRGNAVELMQLPAVQGSILAMDIRTGRIFAMSGGFSYDLSPFNRATQSMRQPGSTFKPFIYLTAFENGWSPTSNVLDSPISLDVGPNAPRWTPASDGDSGWGLITARKALEFSRNFASVRLLSDVGLDKVERTTRAFGLYDRLNNFAAGLGAEEVTDVTLTTAYAMLANGGHKLTPWLISEVDDSDGRVLARQPDQVNNDSPVADPVAIAQVVSVLEGVVSRGTARASLSEIRLPIAGKTGTTNNNVDAWFVGFTPDMAVGVHVGFDKPAPLGESEFGGKVAAPIFGEFVTGALAIYPPSSDHFPVPAGVRIEYSSPSTGSPQKDGIPEITR